MGVSTAKKMMLGAAVGLVAVTTVMAPASAHGRRHHHHHGHHYRHFHGWYGPVVTYGYSAYGCEYYYKKWKYTGSRFWKHKYFACIY